METHAIRLTVNEGTARLTFDQPESRANVLSTAMWLEFGRTLDSLVHRTDVKGHRQYGGTECPGNALYGQIDAIVRKASRGCVN